MTGCVFCSIVAGEAEASVVHEAELRIESEYVVRGRSELDEAVAAIRDAWS